MTKNPLNRRGFCQLTGVAAAAAALPACIENPGNLRTCADGKVVIGPASEIALGAPPKQLDRLGLDSVFILRDAGGVYAMNAQCTHLRCTLDFVSTDAGFACACHLATFNLNGEQPTGPPTMPLQHFAICSDGAGNLVVDPDQKVSSDERYKV